MALATLGGLPVGAEGHMTSTSALQGRGGPANLSQKTLFSQHSSQRPGQPGAAGWGRKQAGGKAGPSVSSSLLELEARTALGPAGKQPRVGILEDAFQAPPAQGSLPAALYRLLDPDAYVDLPPPNKVNPSSLDNRELDKLVAALGRNKATWRRALLLHEWLLSVNHAPDDRLCTTLMRVAAQQGQAVTALSLYEWMRARRNEGGAGLVPTVFTYTAAMRAALAGGLLDKALQVWRDAISAGCEPDCRMCTTFIEVAARKGDTGMALQTYEAMRHARGQSRMVPSVHAYTAAMRAAAEGGLWQKALDIWNDMEKSGVQPTGHAFAAVISACASGGEWQRATQLFDRMLELGIKPDVVSCTALITALGTDGQWERAERLVEWMLRSNIKPNVRTYTALVTAMGVAQEWERALGVVRRMKRHMMGGVEPNAYTYSALLKTMGEHGQWQLAEKLFAELEAETLAAQRDSLQPAGPARLRAPGPSGATADLSSQLAGLTLAAEAAAAVAIQQQAAAKERASSLSYAHVATAAAEQVLRSLDDDDVDAHDAPSSNGQSSSASHFSYFSAPQPMAALSPTAAPPHAPLGGRQYAANHNALPIPAGTAYAAHVGLAEPAVHGTAGGDAVAHWGLQLRGDEHRCKAAGSNGARNVRVRGPVNEVVCGALMLAYERAARWEAAVRVLDRAAAMGIAPNTVMYNTAISALGKAGQWEAAEALFSQIPSPDAVSYETMVAAYGISGKVAQAEALFAAMYEFGWTPRDYAFCGLIAAHSMVGDWRTALQVHARMKAAGVPTTVHVYNALIAACERAHRWDQALQVQNAMAADGIKANSATFELLSAVSKKGVADIEGQQAAAAALSAAVAAAGTIIMRTGIF